MDIYIYIFFPLTEKCSEQMFILVVQRKKVPVLWLKIEFINGRNVGVFCNKTTILKDESKPLQVQYNLEQQYSELQNKNVTALYYSLMSSTLWYHLAGKLLFFNIKYIKKYTSDLKKAVHL